MVCKKCGIDNSPDNKFCYSCGANLEKKSKAGMVVAIVLGALILIGIQVATITLVISKFVITDENSVKQEKIINRKPGKPSLGDDFYDDYDWS